ncbi:TPA: ATP-binding cassette domain-containing protein [Streptococcus agalactiae]|nr:ABC-F family ATP-binding cassette domain-containing protein [Streptococcus agalactiae]HEP2739195.1 ABC-F family ATP-binding cassette domain-containing protein [Streptococcus pyogenes]HEP3490799.1 ABC-F family ATP-binding cassette domain-containing protein [Streptococcus pyogenes]
MFFIEKLSINQDEKIGLIGNNGVGKTTLFRILLGIDTEYSGYVDVKMKISSLLNNEKNDLKVQKSYRPGEYQMLRLDEVLLKEESFLLIDELTSHLDIDQKEKLVKELKNRNKGFIIVSHDRDFINQTCDKIFELSNKSLEVYNGNYTFYLEERIKRQKFLQREYFNYISEKNRLLSVASDIKKQSSRVKTTPKRMGNSEAILHKMGGQENKKKLDKQVKAIESRINQLEVKERPKEEKAIELSMPENRKIHSKILIRSEKLNKRFGDKVIFNNAKLEIENNRKIALLGINGSGKTTLINMIINKEVWIHPNLKIGYYSQLGERLNPLNSILENVLETSICDQSITRIILARLGFKRNDVFKVINILSDGERAKVKLAKLITSDFNL